MTTSKETPTKKQCGHMATDNTTIKAAKHEIANKRISHNTGDAPSESTHALSERTKKNMIVVLFACNVLASLMQSLMNVALDYVSNEYHVTLSEANLLVLGYSIVASIVIILAATLLRRFGLRRITLVGLVISFFGSLLGVIAWDFPSLVAARLIQAIATGLYFPVVNEALLNLSPKGHAGKLLAIDSGVIGIGLAAAPIISGLVITYWGLRVLFMIPTVIALVLFFIAKRVMSDIMPRQNIPIDIASVVLCTLGLAAFMVGLNECTRFPIPMVSLMVAGIILSIIFVYRQNKLKSPLLDMRPFLNKTFSMGETLITLSYMSSIYISLLIPLYFEGVSGFSPFIAGCLMAPPLLAYAFVCFFSGRILGRFGLWPLIPLGFGICLLGSISLMVSTEFGAVVAIVLCVTVACGGIGAEYPAVKSVDLESLDPGLSTSGSSIHSTIVQIAGSISSALFVGLMSSRVHHLMDSGVAKATAYNEGFTFTIYIAIAFVAAATILSFIYTRHVKKQQAAKQ